MTRRLIAAAIVLVVAVLDTSGCYFEAGLGAGRAMGPDLDDDWGWVFTAGGGMEFSAPTHRVLVGTSLEMTGVASAAPTAIGVSVGGDWQVGGSEARQLRLSARITPATLSWVTLPGQTRERGYVVPTYLGLAWTFGCDLRHRCTHLGFGADTMVFHRPEIGFGVFVAPQLRFTTTYGIREHLRRSGAVSP